MLDFLKFKNEEHTLLVNIGNGSITVAIVEFAKNKKPKFLFTSRDPFVVLEKPNAIELSALVHRVLDESISNLVKKGFESKYWHGKDKKLSRALVVFSSPWFIPKIKHIQISKEMPFEITQEFLDGILLSEEKIFEDELKKEHENNNEAFEVIEKSIVNIKINGYVLNDSIGKRTKNFDSFLSMSVIPADFLAKVRDVITKHTHLSDEQIIEHTYPLVSFTVTRDIFSNHSDFVLIDITGEVTDLTLIHNDVITAIASFPSGRNYIIRKIALAFKTTFELAESSLRLYLAKKLEETDTLKVQQVLVDMEKEWAIYFENALLELSPEMVLPHKFFITADSDIAQIYKDFMTLTKTDTTSALRKNIDVFHINHNTLSGFYENESGAQVNGFIAILAIFYNTIRNNS